MTPPPPTHTLFPYTTLFRSNCSAWQAVEYAPGTWTEPEQRSARVSLQVKRRNADMTASLPAMPPARDNVTQTARFAKLSDRKSTRLNSSHLGISYAVFCLKK